MDNIGGAERATLIMARELGADIYTTNINKEKIKKLGFSIENIHSIGRVPTSPPYRQQMTQLRFRFAKLPKKYDLYIVSGDWALSAAVKHKPNIWYTYSPPRELWDLYKFTRTCIIMPAYQKLLFDMWVLVNRRFMRKYVKHIDTCISISNVVQKRLKNYLGRDSEVIYPPLDIKNYSYDKNGDFWLSVNRYTRHKRIEMQIDAFRMMPNEKLIIVGACENTNHFLAYKRYIEEMTPPNVKLLYGISDKELIDLYSNCKGFLTTSIDEDYGLTPIEAMASGKIVVAPNEGGYRETIIDGKTGVLIDGISPDKIIDAVSSIREKELLGNRSICEMRAKNFSTQKFIKQFRIINNID